MGVVLRIVSAGLLLLVIGVVRSQNLSAAIIAIRIIADLLRALFEIGGVGLRLAELLDENQDFRREVGNVAFGEKAFSFNLEAVGEKEGFDDADMLVEHLIAPMGNCIILSG